MSGKITFHFDDGFLSHYEILLPLFREFGAAGSLALIADPEKGMGFEKAREMKAAGWEILSHTVTHPRMSAPMKEEDAQRELWESKAILDREGLEPSTLITPMSVLHPSLRSMAESVYDAAFTRYTNSATEPIEKLVIERPVNLFDLHRACLAGKKLEELEAYVDYVEKHDAWIVFYDHDIGAGKNITEENLRALLGYIRKKGVRIVSTKEALAEETCKTKILREGWDGEKCFVHARMASDGEGRFLVTAQKLTVAGSDCFDLLNVSTSSDGGKSWTAFAPDPAFLLKEDEKLLSVCCDMTPMYHKKTGKFLVTGHIAQYFPGEIFPVDVLTNRRVTPYAVYDEEKGAFAQAKIVKMPEGDKYCDCGSGCSQCLELPDGDILVPISYRELEGDRKHDAKAAVMRCSFDGETLSLKEIGNEVEVKNEVRGIGECSLAFADGRYFLTIRGDTYGYISTSEDGLHFTVPAIWKWDGGEIVPTYNTQSHFFTQNGKLYLVYTRKAGNNDHVFRHRAPLFVAEVDTKKVCLKRETEFIAVPERGARLGNFGVFTLSENEAYIVVSEWMQPEGCEKYGSDNALWMTKIENL